MEPATPPQNNPSTEPATQAEAAAPQPDTVLREETQQTAVPAFLQRCECRHTRGEHFTPTRGAADRCLMQGCDCSAFRLPPAQSPSDDVPPPAAGAASA